MCIGLANGGYIPPEDETENIKSHICDNICRFAVDCNLTQDELDEHCESCIVDKITKIEVK